MRVSGVYKITNTITGDFYIGSSKDVKNRWACHKCKSKWKRYTNNPLYKDLEVEWPKLYNITADTGSRNWRMESVPQGDEIDYYCHLINVPGQNVEEVGRY